MPVMTRTVRQSLPVLGKTQSLSNSMFIYQSFPKPSVLNKTQQEPIVLINCAIVGLLHVRSSTVDTLTFLVLLNVKPIVPKIAIYENLNQWSFHDKTSFTHGDLRVA